VARGRIDEALAENNRALELDPLSLSIAANRGFILKNARRYEEAINQLNRVVAIDPNHYQVSSRSVFYQICLAEIRRRV
jgi:adenylate cyclase